MKPTNQELADLGWRAVWTFLQAFCGVGAVVAALTAQGTLDLGALASASVIAVGAGAAAVLSLIKTFASNRIGTGTTPVAPHRG